MVAKPPVMIAWSSLIVMRARNGRTTKGASVCPTKMLLQADKDSAPDVPSNRAITIAIALTMICMMPR